MIQRFIILHLLFISDIYEKFKRNPIYELKREDGEPKENKGLVPYVYAQPPTTCSVGWFVSLLVREKSTVG